MNLLFRLFPKARAELLRLLFADAAREIHVRDLERKSGLSVKTIQAELEKLSGADLVVSRRDGNRRYFRANVSHPIFTDLQQIVLKTAGLREVLANAMASLSGIDVAFVFGSIAADGGKAASDVDLFVVGDIGLRSLAPALRVASEELGREINPITMTAVEFQKGKKQNPFLADILAKPKLFVKGDADELERLG